MRKREYFIAILLMIVTFIGVTIYRNMSSVADEQIDEIKEKTISNARKSVDIDMLMDDIEKYNPSLKNDAFYYLKENFTEPFYLRGKVKFFFENFGRHFVAFNDDTVYNAKYITRLFYIVDYSDKYEKLMDKDVAFLCQLNLNLRTSPTFCGVFMCKVANGKAKVLVNP